MESHTYPELRTEDKLDTHEEPTESYKCYYDKVNCYKDQLE